MVCGGFEYDVNSVKRMPIILYCSSDRFHEQAEGSGQGQARNTDKIVFSSQLWNNEAKQE